MNCLFCGKGPAQGVTLYRVNATGQKGVWACDKHIKNTDAKVDETVRKISEAFNPPRPGHR